MPDNASFIRSLYHAFQRGDLTTILDNLDPAIEWVSNGDGKVIPWGGRREGVSGAAFFFQSLADNLDFENFEPHEFFDAGDIVTVLGRTRAKVKPGGGVFDSRWAHIFTVKNGKLLRFQEFYDTAAIERAMMA